MKTKTLNLNIFFSKQDLLKINELFGINNFGKEFNEIIFYREHFIKLLNKIESTDKKIFKQLNKLISRNNFSEILFKK